jgi:hypothetical protein
MASSKLLPAAVNARVVVRCYALQDKLWVHGPGAEPWEVYTVKADAPGATSLHTLGQPDTGECVCGTPSATDGEQLSACC